MAGLSDVGEARRAGVELWDERAEGGLSLRRLSLRKLSFHLRSEFRRPFFSSGTVMVAVCDWGIAREGPRSDQRHRQVDLLVGEAEVAGLDEREESHTIA